MSRGYLVSWKRNRNNRGSEIFLSPEEAFAHADQQKQRKFKVQVKKLRRGDPLLVIFLASRAAEAPA